MNREQFLEELKKNYDNNIEISRKKNSDYANSDDPFKNFKLCEQLGVCSTETGMMVRLCDKVSRTSNLLNRDNEVDDEKIGDTLSDLSNYAMILKIYLEQK